MTPVLASLTGSVLASAVTCQRREGASPIAIAGEATPIWVDLADHKGVAHVATDLAADVARVTTRAARACPSASASPRTAWLTWTCRA